MSRERAVDRLYDQERSAVLELDRDVQEGKKVPGDDDQVMSAQATKQEKKV